MSINKAFGHFRFARTRPLRRSGVATHADNAFSQCVTQPIRLVLPDLFQNRLAKLTAHAAHVDMIIGAVTQHDLRVAPVAQWL
jgi:hypothetical protein